FLLMRSVIVFSFENEALCSYAFIPYLLRLCFMAATELCTERGSVDCLRPGFAERCMLTGA
ncbi:hypothetical protein P2L35_13925, partial [Enterococcus faecium]|uniref:hypothetical protein n=1 Tax=Enterococcus faecium TaxID=1352 RepID=UPI0025B1C005